MEKNPNNTERRPYVKPEADLVELRVKENIAFSGDEFDGDDHDFDNA
jgi:hypothetical protein